MRRMSSLLSFSMLVTMLISGFAFAPQNSALAQESASTSAGFVSGQWRVVVLQTQTGKEIPRAKLEASGEGPWAVLIADVTNTGAATAFDPSTLKLGATNESPLGMTNGVPGDAGASATVTQSLSLPQATAEGNFTVPENGTIRLAIVFQLPAVPANDESLIVRLNDQVMDVSNTTVDAIAVADLPALVPEMQLQVADVTQVIGDGQVNVVFRSGGDAAVQMDGVVSPKSDANIKSSCYSGESSTQITNLTGGTVWVEDVPSSGEKLVWFNEPSTGTFGLLNANLIAGGFAGFDDDAASPYASWLGSVEEYAKSQNTGLWSLCKSAEEAWIKEPAPTPVPTQSPEQVRAQYQWVDTRDLVIRPGEFKGDKIAVSGSVFNIDVDGDLTAMQIWLDGGSEAAVIYYAGDSRGIYDGTWITVYGTGDGTFEGTNAFGGTISQPVIAADIVDF